MPPPKKMFDRNAFKFVASVLLLCMVLRHSMFYLHLGDIVTEMGFNQALYGIFLLPVTAAFGCIYFWERQSFPLKVIDIARLVLIASIPILLACYHSHLYDMFAYTIYDPSRRPQFLILLPIVFSIFFAKFVGLKVLYLFPIFVVICFYGDLFVIHYMMLFWVFAIIQSVPLVTLRQKSVLAVITYGLCIAFIYVFKIERIGFIFELIFSQAFIGLLFFISFYCKSVVAKVSKIKFVDKLSVFYFYLVQAGVFSMFLPFVANSLKTPFVIVPVVFSLGMIGSYYFRMIEARCFAIFEDARKKGI